MNLSSFIEDLIKEGIVTVAGEITGFPDEDLREAETALLQYHANDSLNMPGNAPAFNAAAAMWAAKYLYHGIQLTMLRNLDEAAVRSILTPCPADITPEAVYSVDLCLRYLPQVLELAKGLSPDDVLVVLLKQTAKEWPYSSAGMDVGDDIDIKAIMNDSSLKYSYIDRIIETRNSKRCNDVHVNELVAAALGDHAGALWPQHKNP